MKRRRGMYCSGSELLEDLLEEAQALSNENPQMQSFMNLQVEKLDVSLRSGCDWDARSSVNPLQNFTMQQEEDLSKLLNVFPSTLQRGNLGHSAPDIDTQSNICLPLVQEARLEKEKLDPIPFVQADVSKLLNVIPPANQFSSGYDSNSEFCNRQSSSYASAGADVTMGGLEMQQQIAQSLPVTTAVDKERTPVPSSWDNVSRIW
ncbi:hypothetical protein NL676_027391 [Syzygium grande]|nr:hypothetical protein NL676_027391 [Syzygium grande]